MGVHLGVMKMNQRVDSTKMVFDFFHNKHNYSMKLSAYLFPKHEQHGLAVPRHESDRIPSQIQRPEQWQPLEALHFAHRTEHILRQVEMLCVFGGCGCGSVAKKSLFDVNMRL